MPPLNLPRDTDSLCPHCVREVRADVLAGRLDARTLATDRRGEVRAQIFEQNGQIMMTKHCGRHGNFDELLSIDSAFTRRIEGLFPGRDFASPSSPLRDHGSATIRYGRGSVLTIDLTNRCNLTCDVCFADAHPRGHKHELDFSEIRAILDDSLSVKPHRQMSVQFSGGEPTLSRCFLDAVHYAREVGYFCVQCASNGVRFAREPAFCHAAKRAGLRLVYLQFDGVTNAAHRHRGRDNLFDIKQRAVDHLHEAGIDVVLVVTVINGINSDQVGPIVKFATDNAAKITVVSFQPISFTGRDADIDDARRRRQRYTLSHLVHDLRSQIGFLEPLRDWFPLGAMNPFSDLADKLLGPKAEWGALKCGCHPDCGVGTVLLVHKRTGDTIPATRLFNLERLLRDVQTIADAGHGRRLAIARLCIAVLRNYRPEGAPTGFALTAFLRQLLSQIGATGPHIGASEGDSRDFEWRLLFVAGMGFQDLFNFDFRRTEMCIIPYGTRMGEISFCAYNCGLGWRDIAERTPSTHKDAQSTEPHCRAPRAARWQGNDEPKGPPFTPPPHRTRDRLKLVS